MQLVCHYCALNSQLYGKNHQSCRHKKTLWIIYTSSPIHWNTFSCWLVWGPPPNPPPIHTHLKKTLFSTCCSRGYIERGSRRGKTAFKGRLGTEICLQRAVELKSTTDLKKWHSQPIGQKFILQWSWCKIVSPGWFHLRWSIF